MIVTVFRTRLDSDPAVVAEYMTWAVKLNELAPTMPGYISHKRFVADDGERVTIVEFESEETLRNWSTQQDHLAAKALGRTKFFADYTVQVCEVKRTYKKAKT